MYLRIRPHHCARFCVGLVLTLLISACGHRGPLYLPGKPGDPAYDRENRGRPPQQAPAPTPLPRDTIPSPRPNDSSRDDGTSS